MDALPGLAPLRVHQVQLMTSSNAVGERLVGTIRRELLDRVIVLNEAHLRAVLAEFTGYYDAERPHRTLSLDTPLPVVRARAGPVRSRAVLGGLHHVYERAA
jgi:transposase InsO family protein